jgi:glycosyltransferase involved in cell wall biosynthesis
MTADITVCTATIPQRSDLLQRAIDSVKNQTLAPQKHLVQLDIDKSGHAAVLDLIIKQADTTYIAILDDDDEFLPNHLEVLYAAIQEHEADLVYPHFRYQTLGNGGHLEQHFGQPWSNQNVHQVPITWLCRRDAFWECGGFSRDYDPNSYETDAQGNRIGHDFKFIQRMAAADKKIVHVPQVTWVYHDDRVSTLGMPSRW